ncbi:amidohydrolase family protein [Streptomyces sp. NPDC048641]|uniref:amidohydrolase family protein n=1 Tax=unclassified Streptomyces TaxID=2593676 RepID=UPI00343BEC0D
MTPRHAVRIDAHQHFWDPKRFHYPWMEDAALDPVRRPFSPDDLAPELAARGIDGTVLVQTVSDLTETRMFLDIARETPFVHGVVGWVDLTAPDVGDVLDQLRDEYGQLLVGIRHQVHDEADACWLERPNVRRGLGEIAARDLAYDLLVRTRELPAAVSTVAALPGLRFVLDHIAKPRIADSWDGQWATALAPLADLPNVDVKLSGMVTEADWKNWSPQTLRPFIDHVLGLFTVQRVMFGSDWPVCLLAADRYGVVADALANAVNTLSATEKEQVFGLNAQRSYRLPGLY